jgi:hypothetical protein
MQDVYNANPSSPLAAVLIVWSPHPEKNKKKNPSLQHPYHCNILTTATSLPLQLGQAHGVL